MEQFRVTGMTCAACSARVEKAVSALEGVDSCSVNLLTESMAVNGTATPEQIITAVERAGYGATLKGAKKESPSALTDTATPKILRRLAVSLVFLMALMYLSMGHPMWHWPLPSALADSPPAIGLLQLMLSVAVMVVRPVG